MVEQIEERDKRFPYPICVAGERACPPEDCGGPPGYMDFLQRFNDPSDSEHDDLVRWVGGIFDPEGFDVNAVNRLLAAQGNRTGRNQFRSTKG